MARYITNDLSPEIVDIALHSGSPPSWSPGDSLRALDVPQIDRVSCGSDSLALVPNLYIVQVEHCCAACYRCLPPFREDS